MHKVKFHKAPRLGIPSNISNYRYEDSFISNSSIYAKKLIKDLSFSHFENTKFDAKNYTDSFAKRIEGKLIDKILQKKDNLNIILKNKQLQPELSEEQLAKQIEDLSFNLLSESISLNNTVWYIDNDARKNEYSIDVNQEEEESIIYNYRIYFKTSNPQVSRTTNKYTAILLKTSDVELLFFFIEKVYGKTAVHTIKKEIYGEFLEKIKAAKNIETLAFLYKNLPNYIKLGYSTEEEKDKKPYKLPDELLWKHFMSFVDYDDQGSDASYYVLNVMTLIAPKFCMQKFLEDQSLVIKIYNGLDDRNAIEAFFGVYSFSETYNIGNNTFEPTNKDLFVTLINSYIQLYENDANTAIFENTGAHFGQGTRHLFGSSVHRVNKEEYTLDSNILFSNTKENKNKIYLVNYREDTKYLGQELLSNGKLRDRYYYNSGYIERGYYNPLDVVKFTQFNDKGEAITLNVLALYVKHASDLKEWERVHENIRFGTNVLMIVVGIATIASGASSLLLYAAIADMGLATTDIIIQSEKNNIKRLDGGEEFLEAWEKIYTVGGIVTFSPVAIKAVVTYGPKMISSGASLLQVTGKTITNPAVYKRVKDITTKAIHTLEIPNFNKTGLQILKKGFKSIPELRNAIELQKLGVIFVKGANDTLATIYKGVVIASGKVKEVARQLRRALDELRGTGLKNYLDDLLDNIKIPFINNFTKEKILSIPKGKRPSPFTYLEKGYITRHLEKFKKGVSYIVKKSTLDTYGRNILGMPDNTQFVMTKSQMDDLLRKANGDVSIIEKELGIPDNLWHESELIRIDVKIHKNLRVPDGNEMGANELWLPGGRLPTGYLEAVIDNIKKGNYKEIKIDLK